jgi:hypothetical protein
VEATSAEVRTLVVAAATSAAVPTSVEDRTSGAAAVTSGAEAAVTLAADTPVEAVMAVEAVTAVAITARHTPRERKRVRLRA